MGAGATRFSEQSPYESPRRSRAALALTLGLHLLLAWLWLQERGLRPRPADGPRVVTILLPRTNPGRAPASAPPRRLRAIPAQTGKQAQPIWPHAVPPIYEPPPDAAPAAPPAPSPAASPVPAPTSTPTSTPTASPAAASGAVPAQQPAVTDAAAAATPGSVDGGFAAGLARRQAGRVDRELRGGRSGVPLEADTPWARFGRGLDAAHIERSMSVHLDSYTSPDGVVIYRERVGNRVICRRSGSVGLAVAGAVGVNDAGPVNCPTGVTWKHED